MVTLDPLDGALLRVQSATLRKHIVSLIVIVQSLLCKFFLQSKKEMQDNDANLQLKYLAGIPVLISKQITCSKMT